MLQVFWIERSKKPIPDVQGAVPTATIDQKYKDHPPSSVAYLTNAPSPHSGSTRVPTNGTAQVERAFMSQVGFTPMEDRDMPRFYFDYQENDGAIRKDEEGTVLPDAAAAREEAAQIAAEWTKDQASEAGVKLKLIVRVDENSTPLFIVNAGIEIAPT